jgi:hypothetical protein
VKSEVEVMEDYLIKAWHETPVAGPLPTGPEAIAKMRLSLQAQTPEKQRAVLQEFDELPSADKAILIDELARSGIVDQIFRRGPAWRQAFGPSFLVYYSPAFLRSLAPTDAYAALRILAEVYRRARALWPLRPTTDNAHAVTIRIDRLRELKLSSILGAFANGQAWTLARKNDNEAITECIGVDKLSRLTDETTKLLKFHRIVRSATAAKSQRSRSRAGSSTKGSEKSKASGSSGPSFKKPPVSFGKQLLLQFGGREHAAAERVTTNAVSELPPVKV